MFAPGFIVNGVRAGVFVIVALRTIDGVEGAQVKPYNPATSKAGRGELFLPLSALRVRA